MILFSYSVDLYICKMDIWTWHALQYIDLLIFIQATDTADKHMRKIESCRIWHFHQFLKESLGYFTQHCCQGIILYFVYIGLCCKQDTGDHKIDSLHIRILCYRDHCKVRFDQLSVLNIDIANCIFESDGRGFRVKKDRVQRQSWNHLKRHKTAQTFLNLISDFHYTVFP